MDRLRPWMAENEPTWMYLRRVQAPPFGSRTASEATLTNRRNDHDHILNTPNFVSSIGALSVAEIDRPNTIRVSAGSITPSSHKRAEA